MTLFLSVVTLVCSCLRLFIIFIVRLEHVCHLSFLLFILELLLLSFLLVFFFLLRCALEKISKTSFTQQIQNTLVGLLIEGVQVET